MDVQEEVVAMEGLEERDPTDPYVSFFENGPDPLILCDDQGRIVLVNNGACQLFGYERSDFLTKRIEDLVPAHLGDVHKSHRARYGREPRPRAMGTMSSVSLVARRSDGSEFPVDISLSPLEMGEHRYFAAAVRDVTERRRREDHLSRLAFQDELTGLANRTVVLERLATISDQPNRPLTGVAYLDLDHFKDINDTLGHDAGDELLRVIARRLESAVRRDDIVARFGGDEFVVILPTGVGDHEEARRLLSETAERMRAACSEPVDLGAVSVDVSISIGLAIADNTGLEDPFELLRRADDALYLAKGSGRNRVVTTWLPSIDQPSQDPSHS